MSTKKVAPTAIVERLFRLIKDKAAGKPSVFGKMAGIPHGTLYGYIEGRTPHSDHLYRIRDTFGVSIDWLLSGEGEPYLEAPFGQVDEPKHIYNLPEPDQVEIGERAPSDLEELVGLARKVLSSDNDQASEALAKNIRYFAHAIEVERRLETVEARLGQIEELLKKKAG
ncbi:MAG: hypothetical protein AB9866_11095 [Syntrophobacteraceae bacterium]